MTRRGDIHPVSGLVFWQAWKKPYGKNRVGETWLSPDEFARRHRISCAAKRAHSTRNRALLRRQKRKWDNANRERVRHRQRAWRSTNRERSNSASLAWKKRNPDKFRRASAARRKERRHVDALFKLKLSCRKRIQAALKLCGVKRDNRRTVELIGCSVSFLRDYLEQQFRPGMSWENYGCWEIDHRKPLALARTEDEMLRRVHYTNLQPLWRKENQTKGIKC